MIITKFTRHFDANRMAMFLFAGYSALATIGLIILSGKLATVETVTRIVPYGADHAMLVGSRSASASYYKSWGMYISLELGNLTPYNTKFVEKQIMPLVSAQGYQKIKGGIQAEAASELSNDVVTTFTPEKLIWQPQTGTVFVNGDMREVSPNGKYTDGSNQTYQIQMSIISGLPKISSIRLYPGTPHTLAWMKYHPASKGSK